MVAVATCAITAPLQAQEAAPSSPPQAGRDIEVTGQRRPEAEAPRYAKCEALARDGHFAAVQIALSQMGMGTVPLLAPTRMPRNPDWNAAPLSPPGSPVPELGETRFGQARADLDPALVSIEPDDAAADPFGNSINSRDQAIALCQAAYQPGGADPNLRGNWPFSADWQDFGGRPASFVPGFNPARMVRNDRTLPTAFWLFDQHRYEESLDWFRRASRRLSSNSGGVEAALFIGKLNLLAPGAWANREDGIKWLKKAATSRFNPQQDLPVFDPEQPERNTAVGEAAVILGNVYRHGIGGVAPDMEEARRWYDRALDVGHLAAAQIMGDMSFEGVGTRRNVRRAVRYYRQAARFGLPSAQYSLAQLLEFGDEGVPQDLEEALGWYREAANAGHPGALFALAIAFDRGEGVPRNLDTALGFYKQAALLGHSGAMTSLGTMFYDGDGLPQDLAAAREWFRHAAERGDADGMANFAVMASKGEGGPTDKVAAWHWLTRATAARHERASMMLSALEAQLSPEERRALSARAVDS
ncbi:tetratricopeptide repeat protein [Croceibacterium sp. TMG7-5b_MA50]|uniref:tetratricopeptide repeat protein n=1 Tax=Croceibacterium sp. TMG7-5b_MA50 TaxID=3121290 RepID=UPI00322207EE